VTDNSCYGNEFTIWNWQGAFEAESSGHANGNGGDVTWSFSTKVTNNRGSSANFAANPGRLHGTFEADIHVPGVGHTIHFTSHCISTAERGSGIFVTFEGTVDSPPWSPGSHDATVFMAVGPASSGIGEPISFASFELKHGFTCSKMSGQYRFRLQDDSPSGTESGYFDGSGNSSIRGRASLPDGVAPQNHPCADLSYD
jgi:hypothetical protein